MIGRTSSFSGLTRHGFYTPRASEKINPLRQGDNKKPAGHASILPETKHFHRRFRGNLADARPTPP
jgi:hypothetical protein